MFSTLVIDDVRTWKGFALMVAERHIAKALSKMTSRPRVGVMLPTSGITPAAMLAVWRLGKVPVPLNYLLSTKDLAFVIEDAELDAVITVKKMLDHTGPMPDSVSTLLLDTLDFKGLPPRVPTKWIPDDEMGLLLYTSGTSARPKGVILTSSNLWSNVTQVQEWVKFVKGDRLLGVLPQFHTFGITILTLMPLAVGCSVIYTSKFLPKRLLELARTHRPTAFIGIPSMFNALRLAKGAQRNDLSSLRLAVAGGEPLPDAVADGFEEVFGVRIAEGYGLTETSPVSNWCRPQEFKPHSVGRPLRGIDERIVSENGEILGPNEDGEIRIKGPNVMPGYFKRPEETAAAFDEDGYFRTGDMGRFDDDGYLYITGRIKEMLIIGGENVFPREIEEVLDKHPSVSASAVIGMKDSSRGEVAIAFVELIEGAELDEREARSFCRNTLAQFKVPREIRVLDALPRNPTGKILRRALEPELQNA
jgi:long-chain acyl-CoA synthetase